MQIWVLPPVARARRRAARTSIEPFGRVLQRPHRAGTHDHRAQSPGLRTPTIVGTSFALIADQQVRVRDVPFRANRHVGPVLGFAAHIVSGIAFWLPDHHHSTRRGALASRTAAAVWDSARDGTAAAPACCCWLPPWWPCTLVQRLASIVERELTASCAETVRLHLIYKRGCATAKITASGARKWQKTNSTRPHDSSASCWR